MRMIESFRPGWRIPGHAPLPHEYTSCLSVRSVIIDGVLGCGNREARVSVTWAIPVTTKLRTQFAETDKNRFLESSSTNCGRDSFF
jgi:hypothetical protein